MTDRSTFEARLEARLIAHTAMVDRPIDAAAITASVATAAGGRVGRPRPWERRAILGGRLLAPAVVWLALVALLVALVAVGLMVGGRPDFQAVTEVSTSPSPSSTRPTESPISRDPLAVLPGEPWIVFSMPGGRAPGGGLFLAREGGTDAHEILQQTGVHRDHPDWSPDGSRLAFENWYSDPDHAGLERIDIWISDADGQNPRQVTECESPCEQRSAPAWSPDGTEFALNRFDLAPDGTWGPTAIEIMDVATGTIRVVAATADGATAYYSPRWSPDGSHIVFTIETYPDSTESSVLTSSLAIVRSDGSDGDDPRILSLPDLGVRSPDWHPTDDLIVFQGTPTSGVATTDLYLVGTDGTGLRNLTNLGSNGTTAVEPTWTPDGERIMFSLVTGSEGASVRVNGAVIDRDGSAPTPLASVLASVPRLRPTP